MDSATTYPPLPKRPHELIDDPTLGELASSVNAVECDLYMLQVSGEDRAAWLRRTIRDAEDVAAAARALLTEVES